MSVLGEHFDDYFSAFCGVLLEREGGGEGGNRWFCLI